MMSYNLSDLIMFKQATYLELLHQYNEVLFPFHLLIWLALFICFVIFVLVDVKGQRKPLRAFGVLHILSWSLLGWYFYYQRLTTISWYGHWLAIACYLQSLMFLTGLVIRWNGPVPVKRVLPSFVIMLLSFLIPLESFLWWSFSISHWQLAGWGALNTSLMSLAVCPFVFRSWWARVISCLIPLGIILHKVAIVFAPH